MAEDDYDINSLATFLHLTPPQVEKMASRDQLPGRRVGGQWRFSSSEIHLWFEDRIGISDEVELQQYEMVLKTEADSVDVESIAQLLSPDMIWFPLGARTRNSVVSTICSNAANAGMVWDAAKMEKAIKEREQLHPTALENGVAMLHPRQPQDTNIAQPFLALGITSSGLPFGGPRGVMTDVFFLIASADERGHLKTLARLSRLVASPEFVPGLRDCGGADEAWKYIKQFDEDLD